MKRHVGLHSPDTDHAFHRCPADWRRPDGYWRCVKPLFHFGRHVYRDAQGKRMPWRTKTREGMR